jgi:hypothetical protein
MTNHPPILRYSALALPLAIGPAFWVSLGHGVGATLSAVLLLVNFWVLATLGPRVVAGFAAEEGDPWLALWVGALGAKFALLVGAFVWLASTFPPVAVAIGFLPILLGTLGAAVQMAREAEAAAPTASEA